MSEMRPIIDPDYGREPDPPYVNPDPDWDREPDVIPGPWESGGF